MQLAHIRSALVMSALTCTFVLPASGCSTFDFVPVVKAEQRLSEDFTTTNAPQIVIDTFNGPIDVSRGSDRQVQVDVIKHASGIDQAAAEAALDLIKVSMIQKDNTLLIKAEMVENRSGNFGAAVVIAVPEAAQLKLDTSNGHIVCEQIAGAINADTSNGSVEIISGRGQLDLKTSNGTIEIADAADAVVNAKTSNGRIKFRGSLADGNQRFKTSNGRIQLTLPDDAEFRLDASTSNSRIRCGFPIDTTHGRDRSSHVEGVVGKNPNPACAISAATNNGSVTIERESEADN